MEIERTIEKIIHSLREGLFPNEQSISQCIVLPILRDLGWDVDNPSAVWPEFATGEGRVDFALCAPPGKPRCFVEVKQQGKAEDGVKQALEYAFHTGAQFVTLTDGQTWSFYLPAEQGSYDDRRVFKLDLFERYHVYSQLRKAVDRTVWLPSGGSLVIEHTEAMTVIDVNTGRNVGSVSLEQTILENNLEAAAEIPRQLRLRDIGGIIVVDFVDMESKGNRQKVMSALRDSLAQGKTHTRVSDISSLGLVEMSRKRIGEGLLESLSQGCGHCDGRGILLDESLLGARDDRDSI